MLNYVKEYEERFAKLFPKIADKYQGRKIYAEDIFNEIIYQMDKERFLEMGPDTKEGKKEAAIFAMEIREFVSVICVNTHMKDHGYLMQGRLTLDRIQEGRQVEIIYKLREQFNDPSLPNSYKDTLMKSIQNEYWNSKGVGALATSKTPRRKKKVAEEYEEFQKEILYLVKEQYKPYYERLAEWKIEE